jgi:antagonist of KipI
MDAASFAAANRLVGNDAGVPGLEATIRGPSLRIEEPAVVALAGADLSFTLDGQALTPGQSRACRAGSILQGGVRRDGARAYLAFAGGLGIPPLLGSCATHAIARLGGVQGRRLETGDRIPLHPATSATPTIAHRSGKAIPRVPRGGARLRVMPGPQDDWFEAQAFDVLQETRYVVSTQSDRMGYRLTGPPIPRRSTEEMISDATFTGALQVLPSGQPILLMADRQTTGGYPQMATVISADLPLAGQLAPGDWVEFQLATRHEALTALRAMHEEIDGL